MKLRRAGRTAGWAVGGPFAVAAGYHVVLLAGATRLLRNPGPPASGAPQLPVTVLIPSHDEERVIARTLAALDAAKFPRELLRVVVIADNCTDDTATVATAAGAAVWERRNPDLRGKGHAIAWAIDRLRAEPQQHGVVLLIDADCAVSPELLREVEAAIRGGATIVQTAHVVANPEASHVAALRYAGFRLMMTVRPAGLQALGGSAGLYGTGMGFRRDVLQAAGWKALSITEDLEQHLDLVADGHRVRFLARAQVASPAPLTHEDAESQQVRWEGGRARLATRTVPRVALTALRRRDPVLLLAALDLTAPPQSLQAAAELGLVGAGAALRSRGLVGLGLASAAGQAVYVIGGLAATRAPAPVWEALAAAPGLVARKLGVFGRVAAGGTPDQFVRTHRDAMPAHADAPPASPVGSQSLRSP